MIDDEIRNAVRVDPSPELLARVRMRIASEPAPSAWRRSWTFAAGALAAALVVAVIVSRPAQHTVPADVANAVVPAERRAEPAPQRAARPATRVAQASRRSPKGFALRAEPEILLDPAETRALRTLIAGVRDGRVSLTAAQASVPLASMELPPVTDIDIAPIIIEPIAPPSGAEGVRP